MAAQAKGPVSTMPPYIRRAFIRKVYSILSMQIGITVAVGFAFWWYATPTWAANHLMIFYIASFGSMALLLGLSCCCPNLGRNFPTNYLFLFALTILMSVVLGFVVTMYTGESVLIAVAATAVAFFCLTAYACCSKTDFTGCGPYLLAALFCMMAFALVMGIWSMFAPVPKTLQIVYSLLGVLLFSFYIVYDTQLIVGGSHNAHCFDIDDYCYAALTIYLDLVNLFLFLLQIFGERR